MPPLRARRDDLPAFLAAAALLLVGWSGLLVPSLVRSIEPAFGQTDAGIGVYFLIQSGAYAAGSMLGGLLTERFGRRTVLPIAIVLITVGLTGMATVASWEAFLLAAIPFGFGAGAIDGGTNGLILDMYPTTRGRALNLLHLCFSLGALASPLAAGRLLELGVPWQDIVLGTAIAAIPLAVLLAAVHVPSGRHTRAEAGGEAGESRRVRLVLALPLIALAVAIGCYVGSEIGVSNWLVRYLEAAPIGLATSALALFWGCLALGRLLGARVGDRFDHARFAAMASVVAAVSLVGAVLVPSLGASIALFGVVGFAFGPIYPMIMAVAGDRFPGRSAAVSGFLSGMAVVGAISYPPIMGFLSVRVGLGVAMGGAAVLALACGLVLFLVGRAPARVTVPEPV